MSGWRMLPTDQKSNGMKDMKGLGIFCEQFVLRKEIAETPVIIVTTDISQFSF